MWLFVSGKKDHNDVTLIVFEEEEEEEKKENQDLLEYTSMING